MHRSKVHTKWQDSMGEKSFEECREVYKATSSTHHLVLWQPSYFDIVRKIPGIEFSEDIPKKVEGPAYLNVRQHILIFLDNLTAKSGKD